MKVHQQKEGSDAMGMTKEERRRYIEDWQKENIRRVTVKLNKAADADIIEKLDNLDQQDSVQGYIKRLIREDIDK